MNNLDNIYDIIQNLIKDGITIKDDNHTIYKKQNDRIRYIKIDNYMVELDESYNPNTGEKYYVRALFVKTNNNNDIINFDKKNWYKKNKKIDTVLLISCNYNLNSYRITISKPNNSGLEKISSITSINNDTKFYSKEIIDKLDKLDNSYDSIDEYKRKRKLLEESGKPISDKKILKALNNLDIDSLITGNFSKKNKYNESTIYNFGRYVKFLLDNGARKDLLKLPAIQNIILNIIENGDPVVKAEGRSTISYRKPNEDGTFNIYGRMEGHTESVMYEMELDEQETNGYYICLTKKDIRNILLFNKNNKKPDEKIYLDRNGKIIEKPIQKSRH